MDALHLRIQVPHSAQHCTSGKRVVVVVLCLCASSTTAWTCTCILYSRLHQPQVHAQLAHKHAVRSLRTPSLLPPWHTVPMLPCNPTCPIFCTPFDLHRSCFRCVPWPQSCSPSLIVSSMQPQYRNSGPACSPSQPFSHSTLVGGPSFWLSCFYLIFHHHWQISRTGQSGSVSRVLAAAVASAQ